jgi:uncharacterized protein (DUF1697 family)
MTHYISILRGINVGGKRKILMADLKALYEKLGFSEVKTYIQSGNVIFKAQKQEGHQLAQKISEAIEEKYGFEVPVIVRTKEEMERTLSANPFLNQEDTVIENLHLTFLSDLPVEEKLEKIKSIDHSPDQFHIIRKDVFIFCSGKYHQTKLSNTFFEKKLKVNATTRNWKTAKKLLELTIDG